jgi:hypothetical protein
MVDPYMLYKIGPETLILDLVLCSSTRCHRGDSFGVSASMAVLGCLCMHEYGDLRRQGRCIPPLIRRRTRRKMLAAIYYLPWQHKGRPAVWRAEYRRLLIVLSKEVNRKYYVKLMIIFFCLCVLFYFYLFVIGYWVGFNIITLYL